MSKLRPPKDRVPQDQYEYRALNRARKEIRLLVVRAASASPMSTVQCTIKHVSLLNEPKSQYETISYVWGDSERRAHIMVDGTLHRTTISAERVLRRMRLPDDDRALWIDAVCIDQQNIDERGHQVGMMASIYNETSRNLVWLGEGDESTGRALAAIRLIYDDLRRRTNDCAQLHEMLYDVEENFKYYHTAVKTNTEALLTFFDNPWFQRLWVVQEVCLAPRNTAYIGDSAIELTHSLRVAAWLQHNTACTRALRMSCMQAYTIWRLADQDRAYQRSNYTLEFLLNTVRPFETHDARDHVYGMLGLCHMYGIPQDINPDYNKSTEAVFRDATKMAVEDPRFTNRLEYLKNISHQPGSPAERPTWVPNWARKWTSECDPTNFKMFNADGNEEWPPSTPSATGSDVLSAYGVNVATVSTTYARITSDFTLLEQIASLVQGLKESGPLGTQSGSQTVSSVAMTLVGATNYEERPASEEWARAGLSSYLAYGLKHRNFPPRVEELSEQDMIADPNLRKAAEYWRACFLCVNRRLFITSTGLLGLGPQTMQLGDVVTILFGSRKPVILRPCADGGDKYEVVGIAYVHGIMHGEAVREHETSAMSVLDWFNLV